MRATVIMQAAIQAWEEKDANVLASYLSDDVICKQILPQPIDKAQLIAFMNWNALSRTIPSRRLPPISRPMAWKKSWRSWDSNSRRTASHIRKISCPCKSDLIFPLTANGGWEMPPGSM